VLQLSFKLQLLFLQQVLLRHFYIHWLSIFFIFLSQVQLCTPLELELLQQLFYQQFSITLLFQVFVFPQIQVFFTLLV